MTSLEEKKSDSDQEKTLPRRLQFTVAKDATKKEMAEALTDQLMKQMFGKGKEVAEEEVHELFQSLLQFGRMGRSER